MKKFKSFFTSRLFILFALIGVQLVFVFLLLSILESISGWINMALTITGLLMVLWITSQPKNPAYKISWIILILLLPILGITMYFFFSQRSLTFKEKKLGLQAYKKIAHFMLPTTSETPNVENMEHSAQLQSTYIKGNSQYPLYANTQTKYYAMGQDFFADLLIELKKAEKYIVMEYFIVSEGVMWKSILDILIEKAAQGINVYFMYDDIGCMSTLPHGYYKKMQERGIKTAVFNPLRPVLNSLFNNRDHRKITVIDGQTGFCGGNNIADEYINAKPRFGIWKDSHLMLKGDGVKALLAIFLHLWTYTAKDFSINLAVFDIPETKAAKVKSEGFVQPFADSPFTDVSLNEGILINMISRAQKYVYINTPYLVLGNELVAVLCTAAQSGVDIRVTVPHIPDKKMVFWVTQANYAQLIKAGIRIYEYTPGFIHSKTMVCDDKFGIVGTVNLDFRSLFLNFECGVWMYATSCLADMKKDFLDTAAISQEISYADTQNNPWYKRFAQALLRIFGPLM